MADQFPVGAESLSEPIAQPSLEFGTWMADQFPVGAESLLEPNARQSLEF